MVGSRRPYKSNKTQQHLDTVNTGGYKSQQPGQSFFLFFFYIEKSGNKEFGSTVSQLHCFNILTRESSDASYVCYLDNISAYVF